jgi:ATP-binding cassette, subfamily B, multidrug efflux pump
MYNEFGYVEESHLGKPYDWRLLQRLYPFARPYRRLFLYSIAIVLMITLVELSLPYITKIAIDRYIVPQGRILTAKSSLPDGKLRRDDGIELSQQKPDNHHQKELIGLGKISALFLLMILLNFLLNFTQVQIMEYTGQKIMHDLRLRLYRHIQGLSISFFSKTPTGRLVTRVTNDVQNMDELFTSVITFLFRDIFLLAGITIVLVVLNLRLALVSFAVLPFVLYASLGFSRQAREAFRTLRIKIAEINTRFSETITGIKVIQLFLQQVQNYSKFKLLNHEYYQAGMKQVHVFALFMPVIELLGMAALAIVILYGGSGVLNARMSLGELVAFISYMKMFFRPIRDIAEKYNIMQNAMASSERIFLILDTGETDGGPLPASAPSAKEFPVDEKADAMEKIKEIVFKNVCFEYIAHEPVLKDISFHIRSGESVAVVGPTGSGKTTLIHLLLRFYEPTGGKIFVNGVDTAVLEPGFLRSKTALVSQDPFLFSATVRENIAYGNPEITKTQMEKIIASANLGELIGKLSQGLETVLTGGGNSISSGERQLISIARAIARDPEVIILDEATSYVDSETEIKVQRALQSLMAQRTSIIVAHRLTTAKNADRVIVVNHGRVIESGSHDELMNQKGFYFRLHQLQN